MSKKNGLDAKMEKLAVSFADDLIAGKEVAKEKTDCLKALCTYFIATRKLSSKRSGDDEDGDDFNGFKRQINETSTARQ